jgi:hypothetical protein
MVKLRFYGRGVFRPSPGTIGSARLVQVLGTIARPEEACRPKPTHISWLRHEKSLQAVIRAFLGVLFRLHKNRPRWRRQPKLAIRIQREIADIYYHLTMGK